MDYLRWNNAIATYFFRPEMAGRRIFLAVTDEVIEDIGKEQGVGKDDFLCAIRTGPPWTSSEPDICRKAIMAKSEWRKRDPLPPYPPYIAYLAVFVLAAAGQEGASPLAYYKPLSLLLDQTVELKQFAPIRDLWFDLQKWSRRDKEDALGVFRIGLPASSQYTNVGLPRAETLLLSTERTALPRFFTDNHLDPTSLPSEAALIRALSHASFLRASTRRVLTDPNSRELQSALAGFVLDELQAWDGRASDCVQDAAKGVQSTSTAAIIRLCLNINKLAGRADGTVRFKANRRFPDGAIHLKASGHGTIWLGRESQDGWSWPLSRLDNGKKVVLDASALNWSTGEIYKDHELGWRVALPPAVVRLFLPGRREGLSDEWVEAAHLVPGSLFCIVCRTDVRAAIEEWGRTYSEAFQEKALSGLPTGWTLFPAKNALSSQTDFDLLRLSQRRRLRLIGGIKAEGRNTFFHFDRPSITLDGGDGTEKITCAQCPLTGDEDGLWRFPHDAPVNTPLRVECGEEFLTITLRPTELCLKYDTPLLNSWGALTVDDGLVSGVEAPAEGVCTPPADIPTHFGGHIVFLGRKAGELADWPSDPLPRDWHPVWAIVKVRRDEWRAHFVGTPLDFGTVRHAKQGHWKRWREIYTRRKTEAVGIKRVRDFWVQCSKEAKGL